MTHLLTCRIFRAVVTLDLIVACAFRSSPCARQGFLEICLLSEGELGIQLHPAGLRRLPMCSTTSRLLRFALLPASPARSSASLRPQVPRYRIITRHILRTGHVRQFSNSATHGIDGKPGRQTGQTRHHAHSGLRRICSPETPHGRLGHGLSQVEVCATGPRCHLIPCMFDPFLPSILAFECPRPRISSGRPIGCEVSSLTT